MQSQSSPIVGRSVPRIIQAYLFVKDFPRHEKIRIEMYGTVDVTFDGVASGRVLNKEKGEKTYDRKQHLEIFVSQK